MIVVKFVLLFTYNIHVHFRIFVRTSHMYNCRDFKDLQSLNMFLYHYKDTLQNISKNRKAQMSENGICCYGIM